MGVADRTLKTFDYISKGLLPLDDSRARRLSRNGGAREEQILYVYSTGTNITGEGETNQQMMWTKERGKMKMRSVVRNTASRTLLSL